MNRFWLAIYFFIAFAQCVFSQSIKDELYWIEKSIQIPDNYKWYNPELDYVHIQTNKDQIYLIPASRIIELESQFENKKIQYFHLLHKGKDVPFFVVSTDEYFDRADTMIFLGSRPRGDTTWFDSYSNFESFFFTYDESAEGKFYRLTSIQGNDLPFRNSVLVNQHLEYHHKYCIGQHEFSSENVDSEGWVWQLLEPTATNEPSSQTRRSLKFWVDLFPDETADSIYFTMFGFNGKYDSLRTIHRLLITINGDTANLAQIRPGNNVLIKFGYPAKKILFGRNEIEVKSIGTTDLNTGKIISPDIIGFQYCELKYKAIPYSPNGHLNFPRPSSDTIAVLGFEFNEAIVIDTINNEISYIFGKPTFSIFGSIQNKTKKVRFIIADTVIETDNRGFHLVVSEGKNFKYSFFPEFSNSIINLINGLPSETLIFVAFNGNTINSESVNYFESLGSKLVDKVQTGESWFFSKLSKSTEVAERKGTSEILNFSANFISSFSPSYSFVLNPGSGNSSFIFVADKILIEQPILSKVSRSNLFLTENQADVIVVTHRDLWESAQQYVNYRIQTHPSYKFLLVSVDDLYKEFNFGKKSPHAIKRFLVWAYNRWGERKPKFLVLWGDANWDARGVLKDSVYKDVTPDFVPAYGWPATDYWYSLIDGVDLIPDIGVGRIPIQNNREGYDYIEKIIDYDNAPLNPWMKRFLMLSGGKDVIERDYFYEMLKGYFGDYVLSPSPFCPEVRSIRKSDAIVGSEADASFIRAEINSGIGFMYFAGHAAPHVFDTDGWRAPTLNNKGKYGFFGSFSCNTAVFAEPALTSRNEEYAIWKDKGFIGTIGSGGVSFRLNSLNLALNILQVITDTSVKTSNISQIFNLAKIPMAKSNEYNDILAIYHYNYLGDPLLDMKIARYPELYFVENTIRVTNENGKPTFEQSDSMFVVRGTIANMGYSVNKSFKLRLIHSYSNTTEVFEQVHYNLCQPFEFEFSLPIQKRNGIHDFVLIVNPDSAIYEQNYSNNIYSFQVEVFSSSFFPLDPRPYWDISSDRPVFRFIDQNLKNGNAEYHFGLYSHPDTNSISFAYSKPNELFFGSNYLDWKPVVQLSEGKYWLNYYKVELDNNFRSESSWIPINVIRPKIDSTVNIIISNQEEIRAFTFKNITIDSSGKPSFEPYRISYRIVSCAGTEKDPRGGEIVVNNRVYFTSPPDLAGFHVVVISPEDFTAKAIKYFNTLGKWDINEAKKDSSSFNFVKFLKDSIPEGHYVFLIAFDSPFRLPIIWQQYYPESLGSLDSLRSVFRQWGSDFADSLGKDGRWKQSFFFVGRNFGKMTKIVEGFDNEGDSVFAEGFLVQYPTTASISSPVFGGVKKLKEFEIYFSKNDSISVTNQLWAFTNDYSLQGKLISETKSNKIEFPDFDLSQNPFLSISTLISNPYEKTDFALDSIRLKFIPLEELTIERLLPVANDTIIMRGDEINLSYEVRNLSLRASSGPFVVNTHIKSILQTIKLASDTVASLNPNSSLILQKEIITDKIESNSQINATIIPTVNELFKFNNQDNCNFGIFEDSVAPSIRLYIDGLPIFGGENVAKKCNALIEIYDNSKLAFDRNSTKLSLNTKYYDLIDSSEFVSFERSIPLKCKYFVPEIDLEFGKNYITIYTIDPSGNRDTLDVPVYVAKSARIVEHKVYPNPFQENLVFEIKYVSPVNDAVAVIDVYNLNGKKISTISQKLNINTNAIVWGGFDGNGNSIPQGIYFYRISIQSQVYADPVYGKIVKIQ